MLIQINDFNTLFDRLMTIIGPAQRFRIRFEEDLLVKGETAHQSIIIAMLHEFEKFAGAYFRYLADSHTLMKDDVDTLLRELRVAISKLHAEWVEISRACEQRQVTDFQEALRQADEQTQIFYGRFQGYKTDSIPLTYFGRFTNITRSYFNRYPLISLPLYDFNNAEQIELALSHEIGHYIFWNSAQLYDYTEVHHQFSGIVLRILDRPTENHEAFHKKERLVSIWHNWLEETFADICGTLLAGPDYTISATKIARESTLNPEMLTYDDHEHPISYLRPLISLETLRWIQKQTGHSRLAQTITSLETSWRQQLNKEMKELHQTYYNGSKLTMLEIEQSIPAIVYAILEGSGMDAQTGTWVRYEGFKVVWENLGNMIRYSDWLDELTDQEVIIQKQSRRDTFEKSIEVAQTANLLQKLDQLPSSEKFDNLLQQMRDKFNGDETKVRMELLNLTAKTRGITVDCNQWEWRQVCVG